MRKIIEAAFYLKQNKKKNWINIRMENIDIPKIAKDLNFINKTFEQQAERLISLGDI